MTKFIRIVTLLLINAIHVAAYIDDSMMRKFSTSYVPTAFSPQSGSFRPKTQPKAPSRPKTRVVSTTAPKEKQQPTKKSSPIAFDVDEIIRAEYDAWCFRYEKTKQDKRFQIFRSNFIQQMEFNRKTGQFFLLNEYGDMTTEEYAAATSSETSVADLDPKNENAIQEQVTGDAVKGSNWNDFSFAMDFEDDNLGGSLGSNNIQGDAPAAAQNKIFSMGSSNSASEAASPEIQSAHRSTNKEGQSTTRKSSAFAVTVASLFASVSPMGSSLGKKKMF
ncbi:MAG: hypothetical protein SGILL_010085 [Bacillariaceae sp.]